MLREVWSLSRERSIWNPLCSGLNIGSSMYKLWINDCEMPILVVRTFINLITMHKINWFWKSHTKLEQSHATACGIPLRTGELQSTVSPKVQLISFKGQVVVIYDFFRSWKHRWIVGVWTCSILTHYPGSIHSRSWHIEFFRWVLNLLP